MSMNCTCRENGDISTSRKLEFLSSPEAYATARGKVDVEETHMSWAFLTDTEVYKLKKPVRYPFLDFSTIAKRERDCRLEVRLNRRLATHVYFGVVPLVERSSGDLVLDADEGGGSGRVVDWLVRMRRLPADRMLSRVLEKRGPSDGEIARISTHLAGFYKNLPPAVVDEHTYLELFRNEHSLNKKTLAGFGHMVDGVLVDGPAGEVDRILTGNPGLLADRVRKGMVREGHGDLKPEHVFLTDPPAVIDCLEFNRILRSVDILDDLTYLHLECAVLGNGWVGEAIRDQVLKNLGLKPHPQLQRFYMAYRACLRARLALAHLEEPQPRKPDHWPAKARGYLAAVGEFEAHPG